MANRGWLLWVWRPQSGAWWIATLFMIGSVLFALGCLLFLGGVTHEFTINSVFFSGSIFFSSAAFCQLTLTPRVNRVAYIAAFSQFIGTVLFNMNTFDAFFDLGWIEQDVLIWTPNILGSILFQVSGSLAMRDLCKHWWCWNFRSLGWWIGVVNFVGCLAFLASALLSFVMPTPVSDLHVTLATLCTLFGAICFFIGAYLMWPDMARRKTL